MFEPASLVILACAVFGAGSIRGFAGFGDALFFLPIAGMLLPPIPSIMVFVFIASFGPWPVLPQAYRLARGPRIHILLATMIATLPIGFYILTILSPDVFKTMLSLMAIGMVAVMKFGFAPAINLTRNFCAGLGVACGVIGGFTGVPGSFLMFCLLNSELPVERVRAFALVTLLPFDAGLLILGILHGDMNLSIFIISIALLPLYIIGIFIGRRIFSPSRESFFRNTALALIFMSGVLGLPFFAIH